MNYLYGPSQDPNVPRRSIFQYIQRFLTINKKLGTVFA